MYAAGDSERPRTDTVDMMEDMVAEFLGDLVRLPLAYSSFF